MSDLLSCNIVERDCNGDVLWTWTFPGIKEKEKSLILNKCSGALQTFCYSRFLLKWFYISSFEVSNAPSLPNVKEFFCVLWSKDFNPDKYQKLCQVIGWTYLESGDATIILKLYLDVITKGACTTKDNGTFMLKEFSDGSLTKKTMVKDLIKSFGLETILIYTAILLKKKLVIYHHSLATLLEWMPTFPSVLRHRNVSEYLFPWLELREDELEQLKASSSYVAGFCDNSILSRTDLYDVIVNLPAGEISVSIKAKESFAMTKIQKDIALFMVQLSEGEKTEQQLISALDGKTNELLAQLRSIGIKMDNGKYAVPIETLKDIKVTPAMNNFLFQLASAENMLLL